MKKLLTTLVMIISLTILVACGDNNLPAEKDQIAPLISLNTAHKYIIIKQGDINSYHEQLNLGIRAIDNIDNDITDKVIVYDDELDIDKVGEYEIRFFVYDSSDNQSDIVTKTVIVQELFTLINYYPIWDNEIQGEKEALEQKVFNGAWYHKVMSSTDAWSGIEGIVTLPEVDIKRYESGYNELLPADPDKRNLDNPSVYMGGHAASESDVGLSLKPARMYKNGLYSNSIGSVVFRPFWRYITNVNKDSGNYDLERGRRYTVSETGASKTNMIGNWHYEDTQYYYVPGDKVRIIITSPRPNYLQLQIEILSKSTIPYYVKMREDNKWKDPENFFSPVFYSPGHGVDKNLEASFKRVNAIDQTANEGKDIIHTNTMVKEAVWESVYLYRKINGTMYRVAFNETRSSSISAPDATGFITSTINQNGGQTVILKPEHAVTRPQE